MLVVLNTGKLNVIGCEVDLLAILRLSHDALEVGAAVSFNKLSKIKFELLHSTNEVVALMLIVMLFEIWLRLLYRFLVDFCGQEKQLNISRWD